MELNNWVKQKDATPLFKAVGPILICCWLVIVLPPVPWTPDTTESFKVIVKVYKPLGVLLGVWVNWPLDGSIWKQSWPLAPVGLPAVIVHSSWLVLFAVLFVELVPLKAVSLGDNGLNIVWSTVALIKVKAGSKTGSSLSNVAVNINVPVKPASLLGAITFKPKVKV